MLCSNFHKHFDHYCWSFINISFEAYVLNFSDCNRRSKVRGVISNLILSSNVPNTAAHVFVFYCFHIEPWIIKCNYKTVQTIFCTKSFQFSTLQVDGSKVLEKKKKKLLKKIINMVEIIIPKIATK